MPPEPHRPAAFTLVELLVVITIIVVLLSLLAPAMDRAIYQAELAVCGAQMKGIAMAVATYAFHNRRYYPQRVTATQPQYLAGVNLPGGVTPRTGDDRPRLVPYLNLDVLVDPLCERVDLDVEASDPECQVVSSYSLWYGWQYQGYDGMFKLGDRWSWDANWISQPPVGGTPWSADLLRFNLLVSDRDVVAQYDNVQPIVSNSHPDHDGVMTVMALQNDGWNEAPGAYGVVFSAVKVTLSTWIAANTWERGDVEMNYAVDDGSVQRLNDVPWDFRVDPRLVGTPESNAHDNWPGHFTNIPRP